MSSSNKVSGPCGSRWYQKTTVSGSVDLILCQGDPVTIACCTQVHEFCMQSQVRVPSDNGSTATGAHHTMQRGSCMDDARSVSSYSSQAGCCEPCNSFQNSARLEVDPHVQNQIASGMHLFEDLFQLWASQSGHSGSLECTCSVQCLAQNSQVPRPDMHIHCMHTALPFQT